MIDNKLQKNQIRQRSSNGNIAKMKLEQKDIKQFMFKAICKLCYHQKDNENKKQIKLTQL